jgi:serine/threonine protein kinase
MQLATREVAADDIASTVLSNQGQGTPVDERLRKDSSVVLIPEVGDVLLQRWRILAWAGLGSASIVFRGEHRELNFPVAIKIVNRQHYADQAIVLGHLRNEAQILTRLRHSHHARIWDFHEEGKHPFLVTDFVNGVTLAQSIRQAGKLDARRAVRVALYIADMLRTVWRQGIVHRDVKPENILLSIEGSAKLIDFGLAIVRGEENPAAHGEQTLQPRVGTVAYIAPEQTRNSAAVDHRADMYSLGATLYHAVTGRLPFDGKNAAQVMLRHIEDEPVAPSAIADVPEPLSDLILRLMKKSPVERFGDAAELIAALKDVQQRLRLSGAYAAMWRGNIPPQS